MAAQALRSVAGLVLRFKRDGRAGVSRHHPVPPRRRHVALASPHHTHAAAATVHQPRLLCPTPLCSWGEALRRSLSEHCIAVAQLSTAVQRGARQALPAPALSSTCAPVLLPTRLGAGLLRGYLVLAMQRERGCGCGWAPLSGMRRAGGRGSGAAAGALWLLSPTWLRPQCSRNCIDLHTASERF